MTVMTYNVGVFEKSGSNSLVRVAETINAFGADIISLNELDSCNLRHNTYQLKDLAEAVGYGNYHFAQAFPYADGAYGNGIISRKSILKSYRIVLPLSDGAEPRSVAVVETGECVFASVHLDHVGETARTEQAEYINKWFTGRYSGCDKPVILCGDMNDVPGSKTMEVFAKEWELLSGKAPTYPSYAPEICIDYILSLRSAGSVKVTARSISMDGTAKEASDHLPVCIAIEY